MKKPFFLTIFVAVSSVFAFSQATHEISAFVGGGLSNITYKLPSGNKSAGIGATFGAEYTYFLDYNLGIHTGLGLNFCNANAKVDNVKMISANFTDNEGDVFNMHSTLSKYKEKQSAIYLNIPIMAIYQIDNYYALGGFKVGIPISAKYKSEDATITNEGYYPIYNNWAKTQEFAGFGTFQGRNSDGDFDLRIAFMLSLEAGMKIFINKDLMLYSGLYFDCGLNNIKKNEYTAFINYNNKSPENFSTNSILTSYTDESETTKFVEKANLISFGIKVRVSFGM
ncbi:MAG: hypothetical protein FWH18_06825 [Marinilabiliaceae bacterium]|nr:hypothetical protein [Marinilabiliaceae bacterium]